MKSTRFFVAIIVVSLIGCADNSKAPEKPIKAFCIDFNWGPGGTHDFASDKKIQANCT